MTNLVFFGAGASRPFGIPTMQAMVIEFEKTLKDDHPDLFQFYSKIKETLIQEYGESKIDIESMLSVINGIAANTKPTELGHFVFYYLADNCSRKEFPSDEIELGKKLQTQLQDFIKKACKINRDDIDKIYRRSYLPLFEHMGPSKKNYGEEELSYDWKAYTTNYDNIFEGFWNQYDSPNDHFEKIDASDNHYFNIKPLGTVHTFCKLHGSLDWTKEVNTHIIIRKTHSGFERIKTKGEIMLFPIQQKDLYLHPWFTLFQDLKLGLSQKIIWYVIGYAFNDEFIRNAFQESLVDNSNKKLVIINPKAEQIKNKFQDSIKKQIDVLPIKFGDRLFELQFEDYVKKTKTIVLRFSNENNPVEIYDIAIKSNHNIQSYEILNDGVDVLDSNGNINAKYMSNTNKKSMYFEIRNPKVAKIKLELKIDHMYDDEIELYISNNTKELNMDIDYGGIRIASSNDIVQDYVMVGGTKGRKNTIWMKYPIILDKTKFFGNIEV